MADRWREQGIAAAFVYTREAHPAEHRPPHETFDDKLAAAREAGSRWGLRRPVLVDDLEGPLHHSYGLLPNASFVVSAGGMLVYKANWTDPDHLELVVRRLVEERRGTAPGLRRVPFEVEWAPRRLRDDEAFLAGLADSGPAAVEEYLTAVEAARGKASVRRMRQWWEARREDS